MSDLEGVWAAIHRGDMPAARSGVAALSPEDRERLIDLELMAGELDGAAADEIVALMVEIDRQRRGEGTES